VPLYSGGVTPLSMYTNKHVTLRQSFTPVPHMLTLCFHTLHPPNISPFLLEAISIYRPPTGTWWFLSFCLSNGAMIPSWWPQTFPMLIMGITEVQSKIWKLKPWNIVTQNIQIHISSNIYRWTPIFYFLGISRSIFLHRYFYFAYLNLYLLPIHF